MVWKASGFEIITALVGSGVILFILNSVNYDFNQPHIQMFVYPKSANANQYSTDVLNDGRAPANHLRLTVVFFGKGGNTDMINRITGWQEITKTENFSLYKEDQRTLIAYVPRLTRGAEISIDTNTSAPATWVVSATYDQGATTRASEEITSAQQSNHFFTASRDYRPFSSVVLLILLVISTIFLSAFVISIVYKRIRRLITNNTSEFVWNIRKEIEFVGNTLDVDIYSKRIFPVHVWKSAQDDFKRKIFNNYDDYNNLDAFYEQLKERDTELSHNPFTTETLRKQNEELLQTSKAAFTKLSDYARKYRISKKTRIAIIFSVIVAIVIAFLILILVFLQLHLF